MKLTRINILVLALVLIFTTGCFLTPGGKTYVISGTIVDTDGAPIDGVILEITGDTELVIEDFNEHGGWEAEVKGTVTVTPSHREFNFEPREIEVRRANKNVDFVGNFLPAYSIGGKVVDVEGNSINGVTLQVTGDSVLTVEDFDEDGNWEVEVRGSVTVTPVQPEYSFAPADYEVTETNTALDFIGTYLELYTISGVVLNEFGFPIPGATVIITGQYEEEFEVEDENGAWTKEVRGLINVTAVAEGYEFGTIIVGSEDDAVNLVGTIGELLLHYTFDEAEGNTLVDATSNGLNGTACGTTNYVEGVVDEALSLEAGYVELPEGFLEGEENVTFALWINIREFEEWARLYQFNGPGGQYYITAWPDSGLLAYGGYGGFHLSANVPVKTWFHLVVTFTGKEWKYYVDGTLIHEFTNDAEFSEMGPTDINLIGWSGGDVDPYLQADFDDFRVYTQTLPPAAIKALYEATAN